MAEPVSESIRERGDVELVPDEIRREVEQIENQFLAALARGETPTVEEFVAVHPHVAGLLRPRLEEDLALHELNRAAADEEHAEPSQRRLPERIDRYVVEGILGEGAASVVLRGFDPFLDRPVAIKLLRQALPAGSDFSERFAREARVVAALRHAHIVPVFDCGEFTGRPFLVMGLVTGNTLDDELRRSGAQPLDFRRTAELIRQIAEALHYAHERGIIHRDVKPGNILLDERGEPQLADFGLAMREAAGSERNARRNTCRSTDCQSVRNETPIGGAESSSESRQTVAGHVRADSPHYGFDGNLEPSLTLTHQFLGTPAYMSPEQAAGRAGEADGRSDLFSLGIVLYRLLTGQRPFVGTDTELRDRIQHASPVRPRAINARVPRDLETICLKAMEKLPADRYQTARQMADELRRWLEDQPLVITPPSLPRRMAAWAMRNRGVTALGGLALVLAIFAIVGRINAQLRQREAFIAAGAREEMVLQRLLLEGREELQQCDQGKTARVQTEILPQIAAHRRRLLPGAPLDDIDVQIRSLFAASLAEFDLRLAGVVELPIALNLPWPAALHPSGSYAAVGAVDRPYPADFGESPQRLTGIENREPCSQVVFSPDGRWLAFAQGTGGVELWDGAVERLIARCDLETAPLVATMAFDSQGERLWICDRRHRLIQLTLPDLTLHAANIPLLKGLTGEMTAAAFSSDLNCVAHGNKGGEVYVENVANGAQQVFPTLPAAVDRLAWSPDGKMLAAGGRDGVAHVFDVPQQTLMHRFSVANSEFHGLCFTPDGMWLAAGCRGHSGVWNVVTGQLELRPTVVPCAIAPLGRQFLGTSQQHLERYETDPAHAIQRLRGHRTAIEQLVWSSNSRSLVTIDNRFIVRVWDTEGAIPPSEFHLSAAEAYASAVGLGVSDDGTKVATVHRTNGRSEFRIFDRQGKVLGSRPLPAGYDRLAFRSDGSIVSVRQESCEFNRDVCRTVVREFQLGKEPVERGVLREGGPGEDGFFGQELSRDGRYYVWTGPRLPRANAHSEVWDLRDSSRMLRISQAGKPDWGDPDARLGGPDLTLWSTNWGQVSRNDLRSGEPMPGVAIRQNPLAVSFDGRYSLFCDAIHDTRAVTVIASGCPPNERIWLRLSNRDHSAAFATRNCFSPDGRYLAFGSQSGEITLVDLPLLTQKVEEFERSFARE